MKVFSGIRLAFGVILLIVLLFAGVFGARWFLAGPLGSLTAREQILSGPNRIAQYNQFFNICASIQTHESQLDALYAERDATTDQKQLSRINANITGVSAARAGAINQYNANATKDYTSAQFRDSDLPYQLASGPYVPGNTKTQCSA